MRERLLVRHFLWRFLENDLVSPDANRREVLSAAGGTLVTVSLVLSMLIALGYQFSNFLPPGITSLRSIDDRFLLISASMLVMALAAVLQWDALVLDARDAAVLGPLPIPKSVLVRAKFMATALFASAVVAGWNLFPMLLRSWSLPLTLRIGWGALRLTLAQGLVGVAAGVFAFLSVLGLREVAFALLGPANFRRISAGLQAILVAALTTALLLLPSASRDVARVWLARGGVTAKALPSLWFVGLHEVLAGSVIDNLPRTRPEPYLRFQELLATPLYRNLWPRYRELAAIALVALASVSVVTILACAWNNRRLPIAYARPASVTSALSRGWTWCVAHVIVRAPLQQAGFFFTLQALSRRVSHRVVMAASLAIGLSFVVLAVRGNAATGLFAAQPLLLACVLTGFRRATRIPAEIRAGSTFSLALVSDAAPYVAGVKRAGWLAVVVPTLLVLGLWDAVILGPRVALWHLIAGLLLSAFLMEALFARYRRVPFVSSYVSGVDVKLAVVTFLLSVLIGSFALSWVERRSFETATGYVALLVVLLGLAVCAKVFDRADDRPAVTLDLDEPPVLPTQRLNLAK